MKYKEIKLMKETRVIEKQIAKLKYNNIVIRIGSTKSGTWGIIADSLADKKN